MREHRVPIWPDALRRRDDPEKSRDPRITAVVDELKNLQVAPEPRARFRAELRAQLVAVTPRLVAEGQPEHGATSSPDTAAAITKRRPFPYPRRAPADRPSRSGPHAKRRSLPILRPLAIVTSVVLAVTLLLGGAVWMSRNSLPGDALYGLKRASERVQVALDSDPVSKATDYLGFAQTRVAEARSLIVDSTAAASGRGALAGTLSTRTTGLVRQALGSADTDLRTGAQLLGREAVKSAAATPLSTMISWAPVQLDQLHRLAAAVPSGALQNRMTSSWRLVAAAAARARTLQGDLRCSCLRSSGTDSLGPIPCTPCSAPGSPGTRAPTPRTPTTQGPTTQRPSTQGPSTQQPGATHSTTSPSVGTNQPVTPSSPRGSATGGSGSSSSPGGARSSGRSRSHGPPTATVSLSVTVGTCGVADSAGPLGRNLGSCTSARP